MKYLAILGRQPEFGLLELESVLGAEKVEWFGKSTALVAESPTLSRLGGVQKVGEIIYNGKADDLNRIDLPIDQLPMRKSKTPFGLSFYDMQATNRFVVATGLELKKRLKDRGSLRYVAPQKGLELTAAQLKFNNILYEGFELLVAVHKQEMIVAITEQVQDIDWYSRRDYERPARSAKVGMLPPKLAQIMLNTTSANLVYDPFCGTGVIMQEALLQGRKAVGSDLSPEMVEATTKNLQWLNKEREKLPQWTVKEFDARTVQMDHRDVAIVSEGYLGPNMMHPPDSSAVRQLQRDLSTLYRDSLRNWAAYIPKGTEVTITMPYWFGKSGAQGLDILDRLPDLGYTLKVLKHVDSTKLIYRRPDQIVGRQLLLLRKK